MIKWIAPEKRKLISKMNLQLEINFESENNFSCLKWADHVYFGVNKMRMIQIDNAEYSG